LVGGLCEGVCTQRSASVGEKADREWLEMSRSDWRLTQFRKSELTTPTIQTRGWRDAERGAGLSATLPKLDPRRPAWMRSIGFETSEPRIAIVTIQRSEQGSGMVGGARNDFSQNVGHVSANSDRSKHPESAGAFLFSNHYRLFHLASGEIPHLLESAHLVWQIQVALSSVNHWFTSSPVSQPIALLHRVGL